MLNENNNNHIVQVVYSYICIRLFICCVIKRENEMKWNVKIFNFSDQVTNIIMRYVCFVFNNLLLAIFKLRKYFRCSHRWLWQSQFQSVGSQCNERNGAFMFFFLLFLNYYSHFAFSSHACVHSINVKWFLGPVFI